ncbi:MAG: hypothetical protein IKV25_00395 [Clostridia bacterium]|nr:hypothetical protein [Clostridia bacterium]
MTYVYGKFIKFEEFNPCLLPDNNKFFCPVKKIEITFEEKDVFNPATVVKDDKVHLLYRAEDSKKLKIKRKLSSQKIINLWNEIQIINETTFAKIYTIPCAAGLMP